MIIKKIGSQRWAGIVWLALSAFFFYKSCSYPYFLGDRPGAGFFPIWLSGLMVIFSVILIIQPLHSGGSKASLIPQRKKLRDMLFVLGSIVCFIVIAPYIGFTMASTIFLLVLFRNNGYKWLYSFTLALAASILLFLLFHDFLGVAFPVNDLGW